MPEQARSIKGHFDGHAVVLDEPVSLAAGQAVLVTVVESAEDSLPTQMDFDEQHAIQVDPSERVPADFVRTPGSGAGQIQLAPDFDEPIFG